MRLDKDSVKYFYEQPCFHCKWSHINPNDLGLMCCNLDSENWTDYCPEVRCKHFEEANLCRDCKHCSYDGFNYHCDVKSRDCVSYVGGLRRAKHFEKKGDKE